MMHFNVMAVVAALIFIGFTFLCPISSADVGDIDADVVANVTFNDNVGGDLLMQSIDISWNATYSGYLYFFAHDSYWAINSVVNGFTGNPNDNIELGIMDDPTFLGYELRGWRIGYVYSGTTYNIGGSIYEPGTDECDGGPGAYFRAGEDWSYSGGYTGHEVSLSPGRWNACSGGDYPVVFLLIEAPPPESTLSGYVTNNLANQVSSATITLNNSGGSTTSNDTGYYEIIGLSSGTYSITATSSTHEDYSSSVTISGNTEKNITLTRLSPVLTYTDSDTTVTDVYLFWKRNLVVDNVRIYKDTETRLLTTVGNGAYLSGMYSDKNLDCNKGYVYWLQPMDGSVAGPKYRIDAETDPCIDGGSGGTVPDPTPDLTPVVTPGPTVPPDINMTQEEWLNLTLVEKQDVLANITLMAPVDRLFSPLLEFRWEDVLVWGIHLFLILCAVLALDSITTQKMSEYTGLIAIIPGGMFAYLGGYLVI